MKSWLTILLVFLVGALAAQQTPLTLRGTVTAKGSGKALPMVRVVEKQSGKGTTTDESGDFVLEVSRQLPITLVFFMHGYNQFEQLVGEEGQRVEVKMEPLQQSLGTLTVESEKANRFGIARMSAVEGTAIYANRKTEAIQLEDNHAFKANNNSRQAFAKVAGLNIWESDAGGLQLGIGGRGLNPDRTSNFNTRQNGYDIAADALGYPESYYTPPLEAVERIEVVRGAASLQYGTQFGGLLNFKMASAPKDKAVQVKLRQTLGSYGFYNAFTSVGGTKGRWTYNTFYQYKRGDGWRDNSQFEAHTAYAAVGYQVNEKWTIGGEYTFMDYLAQQPGGLTDALFEQNPRQSVRGRNWFAIRWNLMALTSDYRFSDYTRLNVRAFGLMAQRQALGNLDPVRDLDRGGNRDLIRGDFENLGAEARLLHRYAIGQKQATWLVGTRLYRGRTTAQQGLSTAGSDADFRWFRDDFLYSDFRFPSTNVAVFTENIVYLTPKLSITPGLRYEYIATEAAGNFTAVNTHPLTGEILSVERASQSNGKNRSLLLYGLGAGYRASERLEVYANYSRNYRAINFSDIQINNPNIVVDPEIGDEQGFTMDMGIRGNASGKVYYDLSVFYLAYRNRIGSYLTSVPDDVLIERVVQFRTNIGDARNIGLEGVAEVELLQWLNNDSLSSSLSLFGNFALIDGRYVTSEESAFRDRQLEYVPLLNLRSGLSYKKGGFTSTLQVSYTTQQFSDATNAEFFPTGIAGIIPAYTVFDLSVGYTWKRWRIETGVNNLANAVYFTRRATAYPGPGIIPADGRNGFVTLQCTL